MTRALIFDCDGVLADTERDGHLVAFNTVFAEAGLPLRWSDEEYHDLLSIGGGKERLRSLLTRPELAGLIPADEAGQQEFIAGLHRRKTAIYTDLVASGALPGRPGILRLVTQAHEAGWSLAVASTSAEASVRAVLTHVVGEELASGFTVCAGDIVPRKKPAPDIYLAALEALGTDADDAVAVEDSGIGLSAARAAGLRTLVTTSSYTADEDFTGAVAVVRSLGELPDSPAVVVADPHGLGLGEEIGLADIENILTTPRLAD